ncbi:MAG: helix-turn-helix domain-containing protein, partial [Leptolyngbya sp. SIO1D8]|nr:helix-turn-helix domain-containing protein [Leptolyngbya sp. SIO1D8]
MLKVDLKNGSKRLKTFANKASHSHTRERFLALYDITQGMPAMQVAYQTQRNPQTLMEWVHRYNTAGPEALLFRHTSGRS